MKYIAGKSFLFISLKEKSDLTLFSVQRSQYFICQTKSLILNGRHWVACNATPARPAERSRVTYGKSITLHSFLVTRVWAAYVLPNLENESNSRAKATGRDNTPPGHSLIFQIKRGEQNLEKVFFIYGSMSFRFLRRRLNQPAEWP